MKSLFPLLLLPFLVFTSLLGKNTINQVTRIFLTPNPYLGSVLDGVNDEEKPNTSLEESQKTKPELGFPWLLAFLPIKSCHVTLKDEAGTFSPPTLSRSPTNNWCNWTIWAGPQKHILIYIEGFEGKSDCEENQDKIIFQGVLSSIESKVVSACRNHGTFIFATQALAVHVVFLSKASSQSHRHKYFKGRYYIFEDYETSSAGSEEPVLKFNGSAGFSPKSYIMHSGRILDFYKLSDHLYNENWLPVTSKKRWGGNSATSLETTVLQEFVRSVVGTYTQVSPLKSLKVTLNPLNMAKMQVTKPSIDGTRVGNATLSGNLKRTLDLGSNSLENEEKPLIYKPIVSSTFPHVSQNFRNITKLVAVKDHGTATESAHLPNVGRLTTHWKSTHMRDSGRLAFGKYAFKTSITFPQDSLEEQRTPIPSPKIIPVKEQEQILESLQGSSGFSRKIIGVMDSQQHLKLKEAPKGKNMDNHAYGEDNGNSDQYMAAAAAGKNESHGAKLLATEMPKPPTIIRKPHLNTIGHHNVLLAASLRALNTKSMDNASTTNTTTLNPEVVLSSNPKRTQVEMAVTSHPKDLVTRYREHPQRKHTKPNPPYSSSSSVSDNKTSMKVENNSYEMDSVFRSHENYSVLESQHNPGDLLFEITFGIEHKGRIPPIGSDLEKALIDSIKHQVQEKVKLFSNKVKEVKLKGIVKREGTQIERQNGPNMIFLLWLHLTPEEKNISHLLHSQLEDLSGTSTGAGEVQMVLVRDVNECNSGIGRCSDEAICVNGYGTYICQCKEEYEDHSLTKSGTLCVRSPRSGIGSLYSYTEILVGTTVFFISVLVVVISVLCTIVKKRRTKKDVHFQEAALPQTPAASRLQPTTFDQNNIHPLLTVDPAQLKLRAKLPEWPLQLKSSPSETYTVSIEQSECL